MSIYALLVDTYRLFGYNYQMWVGSSAWLERIPDKDEVPGSSPGRPI
jgi:hypothetical protein